MQNLAQLIANNQDLNFVATGGQFGRKRAYPGFVIVRTESGGYIAIKESTGLTAGGARTLEGLQKIMGTQRNPFTGEAFTAPAKYREELTPEGIQLVIPGCEKTTDTKTPAQLSLF